jgi:hypothetical protein
MKKLPKILLLSLMFFSVAYADKQSQIGAFIVIERIDALTDVDTSGMWTPDTSGDDGSFLSWKCTENGLAVYVTSSYELGAKGSATTYRFDKLRASKTEIWSSATSGTAVFAPARLVYSMTAQATKSKGIVVRVTDVDAFSRTYQFDLTGFSKAISLLPCAKDIF